MGEPFDEYFDGFVSNFGPFGASLIFQLSQAKPASPGTIPAAIEVGTLRTSVEHLKVMVFILKRQIAQIEGEMGVQVQISSRVLNQLQIPPEDWDRFWSRG